MMFISHTCNSLDCVDLCFVGVPGIEVKVNQWLFAVAIMFPYTRSILTLVSTPSVTSHDLLIVAFRLPEGWATQG